MKRNSFYHRILATFLVVSFLSVSLYLYVNAHNTEASDNYSSFSIALSSLNTVNDKIDNATRALEQLGQVRNGIVSELGKHATDGRFNVVKSITDRVIGSISGAVKTVINQLKTTMSGVELVNALDGVNYSIQQHMQDDVEPLFTTSGSGHNDTFNRLIDVYSKLTPKYRGYANYYALDGRSLGETGDTIIYDTSDYTEDLKNKFTRSLPNPDTITVSKCANPSGKCYGYYFDPNEHLRTCQHKHGVSGETGVTWWQCNSTSCTHSAEHWVECRQLCGRFYPPPTRSIIPIPDPIGAHVTTTYHDCETVCQVPVYKNFIVGTRPCGRKYFTCQEVCRHGREEGYFSNSTSFSAYGTYKAEVVYNDPIREVYWYFQKPGESMKQVSHDTSGGKTSSWSHSFASTSGTYKVRAKVYFKGSRSAITHDRTVYVY